MRKYLSIFSLYAEHALEYKMRSFVWFLPVLVDISVYLLYWRGVLSAPSGSGIWTISQAISYYLLLLVAATFLQIHIEEEVAFEDIQYGKLSQYLLRPFSYLKFKFFQEIPWRIIQGGFGLMTLIGISIVFRKFTITSDLKTIPIIVAIMLSAYALCFIYKMIVGVLAFWTIDFSGIHNIQSIIFILFSGLLVPLHLLPEAISTFAPVQPLAFVLYYPVLAVQGTLSQAELFRVLFMQWMWIAVLYTVYRMLWARGLREFTAVGQ